VEVNSDAMEVRDAAPGNCAGVDAAGIPGYKPTEVGVMPEDWETRELGEIGQSLIGLTYDPSNVKPDGLLVLRSSNIGEAGLQFDDNVFVDMDVPERIIVRERDLLICARNGSRPLIGKCALIDQRAEGMTFGAFMAVFRSSYNDFVAYCFQSEIIKRQIQEHLGATINQITNKSLNSFEVPFPPTAEQHAIAGALSDVDGLLRAVEALIAKKRAIKQAAMQQLLTGKTRLPGFSEEWDTKRFSGVLERLNAKGSQIQTSEYQTTGRFPVIDQGKESVIGFSDSEDRLFKCPDGGVIVFGDHTCIAKFVDFDFVVGADGTQILRAKSGQVTRFYAFQLQHRGIEPTGYNRHYKFLRERDFLVPTPTEQHAIANVLSDVDAEISALEARRDKTRAIKRGMMQQLLTGRVRMVNREAAA